MNRRRGAYQREVLAALRAFGWTTQSISADPPYAYTVGLAQRFDHPEMLICGMDENLGPNMLTRMVQEIQGGRRFVEGEIRDVLLSDLPLLVERLHPEVAAASCPLLEWYAERVDGAFPPVLRILWPDARGRLPGEPSCDDDVVDDQRLAPFRDIRPGS